LGGCIFWSIRLSKTKAGEGEKGTFLSVSFSLAENSSCMEAKERFPNQIVKMVLPLGCWDNAWMQKSGAERGFLLFTN
jgi:hypothetical protein